MLVLKYICAVIALLSTLIFISNIISNISANSSWSAKEDDKTNNFAALRLILALIMSITWPILFIF